MGVEEITDISPLPLLSLNHVSFLCRSVSDSVRFYVDVLGFVLIKRPSSFKFHGAWLFNYGVGIHLLEHNPLEEFPQKSRPINPKDNHISFQCSDMDLVQRKLEEMEMEYATAIVEDGGIKVDQLFFHDPDGYMIEICNCDNIPILPISSCQDGYMIEICNCDNIPVLPISSCPLKRTKGYSKGVGCGFVENLMMEHLNANMMNFSF